MINKNKTLVVFSCIVIVLSSFSLVASANYDQINLEISASEKTLTEEWNYSDELMAFNAIDENNIYITGLSDSFYSLNKTDGSLNWKKNVATSGFVVEVTDKYVYSGGSGKIRKHYKSNGTVVYSLDTGKSATGTIIRYNGVTYFETRGVYQDESWLYKVINEDTGDYTQINTNDYRLRVSVISENGLWFGNTQGNLRKFDTNTENMGEKITLPYSNSIYGMSADGGGLYIGAQDNSTITKFDPTNSEIVWRTEADGYVWDLYNDKSEEVLYIGTENDSINRVTLDGVKLSTFQLSITPRGVSSEGQDIVYLTGYNDGNAKRVKLENVTNTKNFNESANLSLRAEKWMNHNESQDYTVVYMNNTTNSNVTLESTVKSGNKSLITVDGTNLKSTNNTSKVGVVRVNATYERNGVSYTSHKNITVSPLTMKYIDILPPLYKTFAVSGNTVIQFVFFVIIIAIGITRVTNQYAGIGSIVLGLLFGWVMSWVALGVFLLSAFFGIFLIINSNMQTRVQQ